MIAHLHLSVGDFRAAKIRDAFSDASERQSFDDSSSSARYGAGELLQRDNFHHQLPSAAK